MAPAYRVAGVVLWAAAVLLCCGYAWLSLRRSKLEKCGMSFGYPAYSEVPLSWPSASVAGHVSNRNGAGARETDGARGRTLSSLRHKYTLHQWTSANPSHAALYKRPTLARGVLAGITPASTPVLFVPGHGGEERQSRSLGSALADMMGRELDAARAAGGKKAGGANGSGLAVELFALHFHREATALLPHAAVDQAVAVADAILAIRALYGAAGEAPPGVLLVAHSMGGLAARGALLDPRLPRGAVAGAVTLGSPVAGPPVDVDAGMAAWYSTVNDAWRRSAAAPAPFNHSSMAPASPAFTPLIAFSMGELDLQVWSPSTRLDVLLPTRTLSLATEAAGEVARSTTAGGRATSRPSLGPGLPWSWTSTVSLPGVRTAMNHLAVTWCAEVVRPLAGAILVQARSGESARALACETAVPSEFGGVDDACAPFAVAAATADALWRELHSGTYSDEEAPLPPAPGVGAPEAAASLEDTPALRLARYASIALLGFEVAGAGGVSAAESSSMLLMRMLPAILSVATVLSLWLTASAILRRGGRGGLISALDPRALPALACELPVAAWAELAEASSHLTEVALVLTSGKGEEEQATALAALAETAATPASAACGRGTGLTLLVAGAAVYLSGPIAARPGSWGSAETHTPAGLLVGLVYPTAVGLLLVISYGALAVGAAIDRVVRTLFCARGSVPVQGGPTPTTCTHTSLVLAIVSAVAIASARASLWSAAYAPDGVHTPEALAGGLRTASYLAATALGLICASAAVALWTAAVAYRWTAQVPASHTSSTLLLSGGVIAPVLAAAARLGGMAHLFAIVAEPAREGPGASGAALSAAVGLPSEMTVAAWGIVAGAAVLAWQLALLKVAGLADVGNKREKATSQPVVVTDTPPAATAGPRLHRDCTACKHDEGGKGAFYVQDDEVEGDVESWREPPFSSTPFAVYECDCWRRAEAAAAAGKVRVPLPSSSPARAPPPQKTGRKAVPAIAGPVETVAVRRLEDVPPSILRSLVCDYCACTCATCGGVPLAHTLLPPSRVASEDGEGTEGARAEVMRALRGSGRRLAIAVAALLLSLLGWIALLGFGSQRASALPGLLTWAGAWAMTLGLVL